MPPTSRNPAETAWTFGTSATERRPPVSTSVLQTATSAVQRALSTGQNPPWWLAAAKKRIDTPKPTPAAAASRMARPKRGPRLSSHARQQGCGNNGEADTYEGRNPRTLAAGETVQHGQNCTDDRSDRSHLAHLSDRKAAVETADRDEIEHAGHGTEDEIGTVHVLSDGERHNRRHHHGGGLRN